MTEDLRQLINRQPFSRGGVPENPSPVSQAKVEKVMGMAGESHVEMEQRVVEQSAYPFQEGDTVAVTEGPYKGFAGQVRVIRWMGRSHLHR
jgi:transcription antitermination factor NusG